MTKLSDTQAILLSTAAQREGGSLLPHCGGRLMASVDDQLAALDTMSSTELRARWSELTASPVPRVSPKMLRLALAWEIQARACGGILRATTQKLDQLARELTRTTSAQPGMRLVREWRRLYNTVRPHSSLGYRPPAPRAAPSPVPPSGSATLHLRPTLAIEATMH